MSLFLWENPPQFWSREEQSSYEKVNFFSFFNDLFIYFWLHWAFVAAQKAVVPGVYSLVAVCRLLIAVASLVAENGL